MECSSQFSRCVDGRRRLLSHSTIDKATALAAGEKFDEVAFDKAAVDGTVSRDAFLAAASSTAPSSPFHDNRSSGRRTA